MSRNSNTREGTRDEIALVRAVARGKQLKDSIIPARIDDISHRQTNVEICRIDAVEFARSWSAGLAALLQKPKRALSAHDTIRTWRGIGVVTAAYQRPFRTARHSGAPDDEPVSATAVFAPPPHAAEMSTGAADASRLSVVSVCGAQPILRVIHSSSGANAGTRAGPGHSG